jgi:phosphate transporter
LEKDAVYTRHRDYHDVESAALLGSEEDQQSDRDRLFSRLLDEELAKVVGFYKEKERELLAEVNSLAQEIARVDTEPALYGKADAVVSAEDEDEEDDDDSIISEPSSAGRRRSSSLSRPPLQSSSRKRRSTKRLTSRERVTSIGTREPDLLGLDDSSTAGAGTSDHAGPTSEASGHRRMTTESSGPRRRVKRRFSFLDASWSVPASYLSDTYIALKLRLQGLFRDLSQLGQFASLNYTGFRKILKK